MVPVALVGPNTGRVLGFGTTQAMLDTPTLYQLVRRIPKGEVATYGQLAKLIGKPRHARHVGNALANTPASVKIPWHRVVNAQGRISLRRTNWQNGSVICSGFCLRLRGWCLMKAEKFGCVTISGSRKPQARNRVCIAAVTRF